MQGVNLCVGGVWWDAIAVEDLKGPEEAIGEAVRERVLWSGSYGMRVGLLCRCGRGMS